MLQSAFAGSGMVLAFSAGPRQAGNGYNSNGDGFLRSWVAKPVESVLLEKRCDSQNPLCVWVTAW